MRWGELNDLDSVQSLPHRCDSDESLTEGWKQDLRVRVVSAPLQVLIHQVVPEPLIDSVPPDEELVQHLWKGTWAGAGMDHEKEAHVITECVDEGEENI